MEESGKKSGVIDHGAKVGEGTRVWANAHVMAGATVGKDCNLGENVFVEAGAVIGNRVTVKNGVQVFCVVCVFFFLSFFCRCGLA
jgi:UDP-2-acetamido-3-amino-2,3-dideoxy-glucuronate N-acetyltransferase